MQEGCSSNQKYGRHLEYESHGELATEEIIDERNKVDDDGRPRNEKCEVQSPAPDPQVLLRRVSSDVAADESHNEHGDRHKYQQACHGEANAP